MKYALLALLLAGCTVNASGTLIDAMGNRTDCVGQVFSLSTLNSTKVMACTPENPWTAVYADNALTPAKATLDVGTAMGQTAAWVLPWGFATQGWLQ